MSGSSRMTPFPADLDDPHPNVVADDDFFAAWADQVPAEDGPPSTPVVPVRDPVAERLARILAVEPASCPSLTRGVCAYDFGDTAGMTPLMKMHTLGHNFVPDPIHAGGLRYHGMAPLISHIYELGLMDAQAVPQTECFSAAVQFARTEGIVPAPEPTHAIALAIREAMKAKETGEETVILTALCGHGHFDLAAYDEYLNGRMVDNELTDEMFAAALSTIPPVPVG